MKKILVPSDLSEISENALAMAVNIAGRTNSEIHLVNFVPHPHGAVLAATSENDHRYENEETFYTIALLRRNFLRLRQLADKYSSPEQVIHYKICDAPFKLGIAEFIRINQVDLVVMGTSGEGSIGEFFTGNHAEQVIESAACPVITVNNTDVRFNFSNIVLGLCMDSDQHEKFMRGVDYFSDLASSLGAKVHIVNIAKSDRERVEIGRQLTAFVNKHGIRNISVEVVEAQNRQKGLIRYAREKGAGILAVFTHAGDSFFRFFSRDLGKELSKDSNIPVLTVNLQSIS